MMMMGLLSIVLLCLFAPLVEPTTATTTTTTTSTSTSAFDKFYAKMVKSDSSVFVLNDGAFEALIVKPGAKRPFPVLIYFTASHPKYQCQPCHIIAEVFSAVAKSYILHNARKPEGHKLPPLLFAVADVDHAPQSVHEYMQMDTIPHLYYFEANEEPSLPPPLSDEFQLSPRDGGLAFMEALEERVGFTFPPIPDTSFTLRVAVAGAVLVALLACLFLEQWTFTKGLPYRRGLWLTFSYTVFATAVGGMVYCVIREPPPYGVHQQKLHLFAMQQSSDQFVAEGLVMGAINLLAGLSFVATYVFASRTRNRVVQFVGVNLSLAAAFYFLHRLFGLYGEKTRWYRVNQTLDPMVSNFFFGNMKKGSGLVRRLCRVTQLWLYEYKDWGNFQRTGGSLIISYLRRMMGGKSA